MFGVQQVSMAQMVAGASRQSATQKAMAQNETHLFDKTRLCKFYAKGRCKRGQACTFAHSGDELRAQPDFFKTQLCVDFFRHGACQFGPTCNYAHSTEEIRRTGIPKKARADVGRPDVPTPPPVSATPGEATSAQAEDEITRVKAQIAALQAQVDALKSKQQPQPYFKTPPMAAKTMESEDDFGEMPNTFSRQSTTEPQEALEMDVSDDEEDRLWFGGIESPMAMISAGAGGKWMYDEDEEEQAVDCEWFVKKTFLCLEPTTTSPRRRAQSVPPPTRITS